MHEVVELANRLERFLEALESAGGQKSLSESRRAFWRYDWVSSATVRPLGPEALSEVLYVTTTHVSRIGLDFRSTRELEAGQRVLIALDTGDGELEIPATVVHSTMSPGKFVIGTRFDLPQTGTVGGDGE